MQPPAVLLVTGVQQYVCSTSLVGEGHLPRILRRPLRAINGVLRIALVRVQDAFLVVLAKGTWQASVQVTPLIVCLQDNERDYTLIFLLNFNCESLILLRANVSSQL